MSGDFHASLLPWLLLALAFPLVSFVVCFVIRPRIAWLSPIVSSLLMVAALVFCLILFVTRQGAAESSLIYSWTWFTLGGVGAEERGVLVSLLLNDQTVVMLLMVVSISTLVHIYSAGYMVHDDSQARFFSILGLFTFAMMGLVVSENLFILFCFWELVGVTSYLLIGHWRTKPAAARAGTKALLFNRIGDVGFIACLMIMWGQFESFDIPMSHENLTFAASLLLAFAAIAKSAQLPLMTWLPDAMEGPTPVSALIHSATMVAAGVFVLVRVQYIMDVDALLIVAAIGSATALYAGWLALKEFDLKKILAYSTISQLGIMMIAIGLGAADGAFVHLITHGFFKAGLFLCAGALIHTIENTRRLEDLDPQDIRNMGGLRYSFPALFLCFTIAGASMSGLPLFSGFISKEAMLVGMLKNAPHWVEWIFIVSFMVASFLTIMYTYRMIKAVFLGPIVPSRFQPVAAVMQLPALICAGLCFWFFYSYSPFGYTAWFQSSPVGFNVPKPLVAVTSAAWALVSLGVAIIVYRRPLRSSDVSSSPLDKFYQRTVVSPVLGLGAFTTRLDDRLIDRLLHRLVYVQVGLAKIGGLFDRYVVDGTVAMTSSFIRGLGGAARSMVKGRVQSYLFWALAGFVVLIFWFLR